LKATLTGRTNPITPVGFAAMQVEYHQLMSIERPAIVDVVSWAAGNGDRSENGDYIYGRQKLRDIEPCPYLVRRNGHDRRP
jgi:transcription elongation factor GreB